MSINTRLATLERAATPIESAKAEQARRLIDLLLGDPAASAATNRIARLVASGETPETCPELDALADELRTHLERIQVGKAAR